jgi:hypothetical protein
MNCKSILLSYRLPGYLAFYVFVEIGSEIFIQKPLVPVSSPAASVEIVIHPVWKVD